MHSHYYNTKIIKLHKVQIFMFILVMYLHFTFMFVSNFILKLDKL